MELIVQKREIFGRKVEALRQQGLIPAELYGRDRKNIHLSVSAKEFSRLFKKAGETTVINLILENEKLPVLIYDVSINPLNDQVIHVDFYQVRMDEKITTLIPLEFVGEASAVKEKNGILVKAMKAIEVQALPADLPRNIEINLSKLSDIGMSVYVKDLSVGKGVKILVDPETVVATITEPVKEEVVEKPVAVEEIKVEGEEKRIEKEKEKQEEEKKQEKKTE